MTQRNIRVSASVFGVTYEIEIHVSRNIKSLSEKNCKPLRQTCFLQPKKEPERVRPRGEMTRSTARAGSKVTPSMDTNAGASPPQRWLSSQTVGITDSGINHIFKYNTGQASRLGK